MSYRILIALFLLGPLVAQGDPASSKSPKTVEKPLLWRIETAPPSYVFGTIHVGDPRVTAISPSVDNAIENSDAVYTELPLDSKIAMAMFKEAMLPRGEKLADHIGEELSERVEATAKKLGLPARAFRRMQPWAVASGIPLMKDQMREMAEGKVALDQMIYSRAEAAGKVVGGLETLGDQLDVFRSLDEEGQRHFLISSLDGIDEALAEGKSPLEELIGVYLQGDLKALAESFTEFGEGMPKELSQRFLDRLLTRRNHTMTHEMVRLLQTNPTRSNFYAIGAAHLFGEEGILALLSKRGYTVTRIPAQPTAKQQTQRIEALKQRRSRLNRELERIELELSGR